MSVKVKVTRKHRNNPLLLDGMTDSNTTFLIRLVLTSIILGGLYGVFILFCHFVVWYSNNSIC